MYHVSFAGKVFTIIFFIFSLLFLWFSFDSYNSSKHPIPKTVAEAIDIPWGTTFYKLTDGKLLCDKQFSIVRNYTDRYGVKQETHNFAPMVDSKNNVLFVDFSEITGGSSCPAGQPISGMISYSGYSSDSYATKYENDVAAAEKSTYLSLGVQPQPFGHYYFTYQTTQSEIWLVYIAGILTVVSGGILLFVVKNW